jgi:UDP-hydrolysing UDP-N-acetyl-D-glucosamine 2-epimerase
MLREVREVAVLTTGRQDYGLLRGSMAALRAAGVSVRVWAGGMHLDASYGDSLAAMASDGNAPDALVGDRDAVSDPTAAAAATMRGTSSAIRERRPDALVLIGDRSETLAAALASTLEGVPIVHLHGGEETEGAVDNACRHAITKLAHLHLVSHACHARRVIQMGEDAAAVIVVGAPGLDNLWTQGLPDRAALETRLGVPLVDPVVLVTLHPETLGVAPHIALATLSAAMERVDATYLVTLPNNDTGGSEIRAEWRRWAAGREKVIVVEALGTDHYWAALRLATAVLGNSSSGVIEAPAANVPVVNVGDRQRGRLRTGAIEDVPWSANAITDALRRALTGATPRASGESYPRGAAAPRIARAIATWRPSLPARKAFVDAP